MRILITGACGFVGSVLARELAARISGVQIVGIDNLIRRGSELNRASLAKLGARFVHADIRNAADIEMLPPVDFVIDAAANASVLAGVDGQVGSRQLVEHNLEGTINLLEYCKRHRAGFILLSTSRVYAIAPLAALEMEVKNQAFQPKPAQAWPRGCSPAGLSEEFSTRPPLSIYGSTKLSSELLALEYGDAFSFPVWINRCGVLAGAGQFGRADQGIFSFWIHAYAQRRPLKYIGFDGLGHQVRDALHPGDLAGVIVRQFTEKPTADDAIMNFAGGAQNSMSLRQLSHWCERRFGEHSVQSEPKTRPFDIPWMVLDSSAAFRRWQWQPRTRLPDILEEISRHAEANPSWLEITNG